MFKGIKVVSIAVPDLAQARRFYRDVLGLGEPLYDLPEAGWIEFGTGETSGNIAITQAKDGWSPSASATIVLRVDDCEASCAELGSRGVRCEDPQVFPGDVTFCSFYDPFGNRLQMCSPAPSTEMPVESSARGNLFSAIPTDLPQELTTVLRTGQCRIERIVSRGHASAPSSWYDQPEDEFVLVLQGGARLAFPDGREARLDPGDWCILPAHQRHRVAWTDPDHETVWLAVFMPPVRQSCG